MVVTLCPCVRGRHDRRDDDMSGADAIDLQGRRAVAHLRAVLGDATPNDDGGDDHLGLAWWYPQVKAWPTVRSVGASGGGGGSAPMPLNVEAVDFIGGHYWVGERSQDRCSTAELMDEDNYRAGFEPTVLGLERSVRAALGQTPPPARPRTGDPLQPSPAVVAALGYLWEFAPEIAADELLHELVREEAIRLVVRARGMMHGSKWSAGRGPCTFCHLPESVISDEDRAVCINPWCRDAVGGRRCWRFLSQADVDQALVAGVDAGDWLEVGWLEVPEPDVRGRGQVSDEQLSRWAQTG